MSFPSPTLERLGHTVQLPETTFDAAKTRLVEALKAEGFGVLTEIDVTATIKAKLGHDFKRYVILGACNPTLAHQALSAEPGVGLLLPCNACVWDEAGVTTVSVVRPDTMFSLVQHEGLRALATEADARLRRAVSAVKGQG